MITPSAESELERQRKAFLEYLEVTKNRSSKTTRNYGFYLARFLQATKVTKPDEITPAIIKEYRLLLNRWRDSHDAYLSKTTQNYHLIAIRAFLKFLAREDVPSLAAEKVELLKLPERQVDFLEGSDL